MNLGAQLGPVSITKLSPNWACQMSPIHLVKFLLSGCLSVRLSVSECVRRWICLCDYLCLALTACLLQVGPWLSASTVFLCLRLPMSVHLSERRIIFPYNVRPERGNLPWILVIFY